MINELIHNSRYILGKTEGIKLLWENDISLAMGNISFELA
jgi:hypothetical protein